MRRAQEDIILLESFGSKHNLQDVLTYQRVLRHVHKPLQTAFFQPRRDRTEQARSCDNGPYFAHESHIWQIVIFQNIADFFEELQREVLHTGDLS